MTFISISAVLLVGLVMLALSAVAPELAIKAFGLALLITIIMAGLRVRPLRIALGVALGLLIMLLLELALPRFR